jgi:glycosyltransferase involved in cell wall biosynthesis
MAHLCFVSDEISPGTKGGIGRLIAAAAKELHAAGWRVSFLLATTRPQAATFRDFANQHLPGARVYHLDDLLTDLTPDEDIPLWGFHYLAYWQSYRIALALRRLCRNDKPDLIEFNDYRGLGAVTLAWRNLWGEDLAQVRCWVRLHGAYELWVKADDAEEHTREQWQTFSLERQALAQADGWIAPSPSVSDGYRDYYKLPHMRSVVSAPPYAQYGPGHTHPRKWRADPPLTRRLLFYGKLQRIKGPDVLINAMIGLLKRGSIDVELELVGQDVRHPWLGSTERQLRRLIPPEFQDRFHFRGRQDPSALERLALSCDIAIIPSRVETFCLAAHELNWIGIPLVLARLPAFVDLFSEGRTCRYFDGTAEDLERVLADVLQAATPFAGWEWNGLAVAAMQRTAQAYAEVMATGAMAPIDEPDDRSVVSVIVPYFNAHATLEETLRSILASDHKALEVIVIDDGSSEPEASSAFARLERELGVDKRFRFVRKANGGLASARNAGLDLARGDFILPLDSDDVIEPDYIRLALKALQADPDLEAVSCLVSYFDDGQSSRRVVDYVIPYPLDPLLITLENRAGVAGSVFRRRVFATRRYDEGLGAYEDWSLWWSLAETGARTAVLPRILYRYRRRPDGMYASESAHRHTFWLGKLAARHPGLLAENAVQVYAGLRTMEAEARSALKGRPFSRRVWARARHWLHRIRSRFGRAE